MLYFKCIAAFLSKKRNINNTDSILDDATLIMVNLFIRSFAKIDDVKMEYSVQITFRQKWSDDRLTYQHRLVEDMESEYRALSTDIGNIINQIHFIYFNDNNGWWSRLKIFSRPMFELLEEMFPVKSFPVLALAG